MSKHTDGPWALSGGVNLVGDPYSKLGQHALYCARVSHPDFIGDICTVQSADHVDEGITRKVAEANARLIASAPDMLEALQNLENDDGSIPAHAWAMVQAAIKKATGEQA